MDFPYADLDPMTSTVAKRAALAAFEKILQSGRPFALLMLDLDLLKRFQDVRSHQSGDKAIRIVATILVDAWTKDCIPCRYGGEEFIVALAGADEKAARATAERLRAAVEARVFPDYQTGEPVRITISVGVAGTWQGSGTLPELLRRADDALNDAKHAGRNRVCG